MFSFDILISQFAEQVRTLADGLGKYLRGIGTGSPQDGRGTPSGAGTAGTGLDFRLNSSGAPGF